MKKRFLILAMMFAFIKPVHAQVVSPLPMAFGVSGTFATASATQIIGMMGGAVFGVWVFPYLNTTGEKPFEDVFTSVSYTYPGDKRKAIASSVRYGKPYYPIVNGHKTIRSDGF